ncbi:uncharacterized protein LOC143445783 [Clavelina lepadiformis]|uniref:uncharacterized protein LOC143445783 n=1 Tax=Clavelina lepadiformis TaxID=159417 RepID=UPI0040426F1C
MQCINGEANPPANCNFTFHMTQSNTVSSVSGCSISYDLDQSSLVSCTAGNEVGSRSSNNETITVVPAQRNLEFNVTGSNITNTGERVASYPGENLTFICNIAFSDQLNTTYELKVSDKKLFVQSFDLKPIKPSNTAQPWIALEVIAHPYILMYCVSRQLLIACVCYDHFVNDLICQLMFENFV